MVIILPNQKSNKSINPKHKYGSEDSINLKEKEDKISILNRDEYRRIGIMTTIILVIIATSFILLQYLQNNTPLQTCEGVVYQAQRNSCIQSLAINTNNVSICQKLPQTNKYACIDNMSLKFNNINDCATINQSKASSECVTNLAMKNENVNYCNKISNNTLESNCIYTVAKSGYLNNISYCNTINNQTEKNNCKYIYDYDMALSKRNVSYCSDLPNVTTTSTLDKYTLINSYPILSNMSFLFTAYTANLSDRQVCYVGLSKLQNSSNICTSLNGANKKTCLNQSKSVGSTNNNQLVINTTNLPNLCSGINKSKNYFLCEFSSLLINASKNDNYSACLSASNENYANICLINLATEYNNTADCNYIQNLTIRSLCISNVTK